MNHNNLVKLLEIEEKVDALEKKINAFIKLVVPSVTLDPESVEGMPLILTNKKQQTVKAFKE